MGGTRDQIQADRSGMQNIFEASAASGTSKETVSKLTGIGPSSQEGWIGDCRDFMRDRHIEEWTLDHPYLCRPRQLTRIPGANYETFKKGVEHRDPAICSNVVVGVAKVTCYPLDRLLKRLEPDFHREGGLREHMTAPVSPLVPNYTN